AAFTAHNNAADWPSPTNSLDGAVLMRSPDPLVTPGVAGLSLNYTTEAFLVGDSSNCQIRMSPDSVTVIPGADVLSPANVLVWVGAFPG
ncbi:MAG: hypothetical protein GY862_32720, partial [Gammaproteobacteria bacterium]|nr:hypothetical protein [Gammaproteobacteria bacterium]